MSRRTRVLYVDDDLDEARASIASAIESALDVQTEHPSRLDQLLGQAESGFDLFLVDYKLDTKKDSGGKKYPWKGPAVASIITGLYPEYPVYMVSKQMAPGSPRQPGFEAFDRLLSVDEAVKNRGALLQSDAKDYEVLREARKGSRENLLRCLAVPQGSVNELVNCLPSQLRNGIPDEAAWSVLGHHDHAERAGTRLAAWWIRTQLLVLGGALFDPLRTATLLGGGLEWFLRSKKAQEFAKPASYRGVFSDSSEPRWWRGELESRVYAASAQGKAEGATPGEVAQRLLRIPAKSRAICAVCEEQLPDTVAHDRDDRSERRAVHRRCSTIDRDLQVPPFFEPIRVFDA